MSGLSALIEAFGQESALADYTTEEGRALFDLLLLTVMIDGEVTDEELEQLGGEVDNFPFNSDGKPFSEAIEEHGIAVKEELEDILDDMDAVDDFIASRAALITGVDKRAEALRIIAAVAYSDGVDPSEEDLCHQVGEHFGFDEDEVEDALLMGSVSRLDD